MKKGILFICFALCLFAFSGKKSVEMEEPYVSVVDLPFDDHGWFDNHNQLKKILKDRSPLTIIEVGSWLGSSTRYMAQNQPTNGKLYAVDTWRGPEMEPEYMQQQAARLPHLYQQFLSNIKHTKLTHKIIPVRMSSMEAADALNVMADLIYIDASHDTKSVIEDVLAWSLHLKKDGILCGDDWLWPSVQEGVCLAASMLNKKILIEGNFWRFE